MSHPAQMDFVAEVKALFPEMFTGRRVLEVGSLNVNGSVRQFFQDCEYTGLDIVAGPGVDVVRLAHTYKAKAFEVVISCEMLEHDPHWAKTLKAMARLTAPGGLLVITCAGPRRPVHSPYGNTERQAPAELAGFYRNLEEKDLVDGLGLDGGAWPRYAVRYAGGFTDLYLWARKEGNNHVD